MRVKLRGRVWNLRFARRTRDLPRVGHASIRSPLVGCGDRGCELCRMRADWNKPHQRSVTLLEPPVYEVIAGDDWDAGDPGFVDRKAVRFVAAQMAEDVGDADEFGQPLEAALQGSHIDAGLLGGVAQRRERVDAHARRGAIHSAHDSRKNQLGASRRLIGRHGANGRLIGRLMAFSPRTGRWRGSADEPAAGAARLMNRPLARLG